MNGMNKMNTCHGRQYMKIQKTQRAADVNANLLLPTISPDWKNSLISPALEHIAFQGPASSQLKRTIMNPTTWASKKTQIPCLFRLLVILALIILPSAVAQDVLPNGSFSYNIPIDVPPGTGDMKPALALKYNSSGGNGWVGIGWSLGGFPVITRDPTYGVTFNSDDHYIYSGQQLAFGGTYYHTERENYERIQAFNLNTPSSYWKVTAQNGTQMFFGYRSSSHTNANDGHIDAVGKGGKALVWSLSRVEDIHGNYLTITYDEDTVHGTYYPERIIYTQGNGLTTGFKTVEFTWESRSDHFKTYIPSALEMTKRLKEIEVKFNGNPRRKYILDYEYGTTSGLSRLVRCTQWGSDGVSYTTSLPPIEFDWIEGENGFDPPVEWHDLNEFSAGEYGTYPRSSGSYGTYNGFIDMDGDGLLDRAFHKYGNDFGLWVAKNNGNGFEVPTEWHDDKVYLARTSTVDTYLQAANGNTVTLDLIDMNGDGRPDRVFHLYGTDSGLWVAENNGTGFNSPTEWHDLNEFGAGSTGSYPKASNKYGIYNDLIDMDGDGRPDRVFYKYEGNYGLWIAINNGSGFEAPSEWLDDNEHFNKNVADFYPQGSNSAGTYADLIDMNGDGRPDRTFYVYGNDYGLWVAINNGSGFNTPTKWHDKNEFVTNGYGYGAYPRASTKHGTYNDLIDMNGDGRPDRVFHKFGTDYGLWVAINNGSGFDTPSQWQEDDAFFESDADTFPRASNPAGTYADLIDMNGDRKPDRVVYRNGDEGLWVALNTGKGFTALYEWHDNNAFFQGAVDTYPRSSNDKGTYNDLIDLNSDGRLDRVFYKYGNDIGLWVALNKQKTPDLITSIRNGKGGTVTVTYHPATQVEGAVAPENTLAGMRNLANKSPRRLVTHLSVDGGLDPPAGTTYEYYNGQVHGGFPWEVEVLGFETIKKIDDHSGSYVISVYNQDIPIHGTVKSVHSFDAGGNPFIFVENTFTADSSPVHNAVYVIHKTALHTYDYNGDASSTPKITKSEYTQFDDYGNMLKKVDWGEIGQTTLGDPSTDYDIFYDKVNSYNDYAVNLSDYVIVPTRTYTASYNLDRKMVRSSAVKLFYDNSSSLGTVTKGLVTRKESFFGTGVTDRTVETFGYDQFGSPIWYKDARANAGDYSGYTTQTEYDPWCHVYETETANALGHTATTEYDPKTFRPVQITDANSLATLFRYDAFGNIIKTILPGDTVSQPTEETILNYTDRIAPTCVIKKQRDRTGTIDTYTYYDGLGRVIQVKTEAQTANTWITTDTWYDHLGKVIQQSVPYYTTGTPNPNLNTDPRDANQNMTTTEYDAADRPVEITSPDGTTNHFEYGTHSTTVIDANQHVTKTEIAGTTKTIREYSGTYPTHQLYAVTTIESGIDGIRTTDNAGNVTVAYVDLLGRKTSTLDPDMGHWRYTYDANGNVKTQTNAKNQTIRFSYDALGRITLKDVPSGPDTSFFYDRPGHGHSIGHLTGVVYGSSDNSDSFSYDNRSRVSAKTRTIDGMSKTMHYAYDSLDRIESITYPDGEVVSISHSPQGVFLVTGDHPYLKTASFNAFNQITKLTYGNNVVTNYNYYDSSSKYDPSSQTYFNYRLRKVTTSPANVLGLRYEYDRVGNIKKKADLNTPSRNETYNYDHLNRLVYANSSAYGAKLYTYDAIGNMLSKDGRSYAYDQGNHQVTSDGIYTFHYDANGNMIARREGGTAVQSYTYNVDNMITELDDEGDLSQYSYFENERIRKNEGGVITRYFFTEYEEEEKVDTGQRLSIKYYFANSQRIARVDTIDGLLFYHQDHLGSSTRLTNMSRAVVRSQGYQPYGEDSYSSGNTFIRYKFTGQEEDATGLYYYGARYYDPYLGRFLQADTLVPDPSDPQAYNRYSYVLNNPILYTDPTGNFAFIPAVVSAVANQAAIGAALGAIKSGVTGGDILEGALQGAIGRTSNFLFGPILGGAVSAAITGDDIGMGALSSTIGYGIGLAFPVGDPQSWVDDLKGFAVSAFSSGLSGGISAEIQGGDFWEGAESGAIGGLIDYAILVDLPDAIENAKSPNPRFHLFLYDLVDIGFFAYDVYKYATGTGSAEDVILSGIGLLPGINAQVAKIAGKKLAPDVFGPCRTSFVAETKILGKNGLVDIEDIKIGDRVWAYNETTGERILADVIALYSRIADSTFLLEISGEIIEVTGEHPFFTRNKGWVDAALLEIGDQLLNSDNLYVSIDNIEKKSDSVVVYNFQVDVYPNYYVSDRKVLVHNCGSPTPKNKKSWKLGGKGSDKVVAHKNKHFGKFFRRKGSKEWWAKDVTGHGKSKFKVFQETDKGLKWIADADEFGQFIDGKHKGGTGNFIPWKDLSGANK